MKNATKRIIEEIPVIEKYLKGDLPDQMDEHSKVFLNLALFFEQPNHNSFSMERLFELRDEWLELALETVHVFFAKDTYLINNPTHSFIKDEDFLNQSRFVEFLTNNGLKYSKAKLSMYIKRGTMPEPDLILNDTKYWHIKTCEEFLQKQLATKYVSSDTNSYI